jgi:hypothetical protein
MGRVINIPAVGHLALPHIFRFGHLNLRPLHLIQDFTIFDFVPKAVNPGNFLEKGIGILVSPYPLSVRLTPQARKLFWPKSGLVHLLHLFAAAFGGRRLSRGLFKGIALIAYIILLSASGFSAPLCLQPQLQPLMGNLLFLWFYEVFPINRAPRLCSGGPSSRENLV